MHGKIVGWRNGPELSDDIFPIIYNFSRGIPRPINMLFSRLLLNGYISEKHELDASDVQQTIEHLDAEKLTPFVDQNPPTQKVKAQFESPADELSNTSFSDSMALKSLGNSSFNQVNSPTAVLSKHSKESSLWRLTLFSFIAGVAASVCFVAIFRFFNEWPNCYTRLSHCYCFTERLLMFSRLFGGPWYFSCSCNLAIKVVSQCL